MANPFYTNALQVLQSMGQVKPGDNVRIQEFSAVDTYVVPLGSTLTQQQFFSNSITKNFPYRNITFPDTSRSYVFQYASVQHNFAFDAVGSSTANYLLESFQRFSTLQWVVNGVQSPAYWLKDFMDSKWQSQFISGQYNLDGQAAYQTWYELQDPLNLAAGVNATFVFQPQAGLTTLAAPAIFPYAPNTGVTTSNYAYTMTLILKGAQYTVLS